MDMARQSPGAGVFELDCHGMTWLQAQTAVEAALRRARPGTYRIRVIHGYRSGTVIRDHLRQSYRSHPKVIRLEAGFNQGVTDLVLREF